MALAGAASAFWTRNFDAENVERPQEEYQAEYERFMATRQEIAECSKEEIAAAGCDPKAHEGWDLQTHPGQDFPECTAIGEQELKASFFVPDKSKPCCKYHGCIVSDCKALKMETRYNESAPCYKDDNATKSVDTCKRRVQKKTCGCKVMECEREACKKDIKCDACDYLSSEVNECNCLTKEVSCKRKEPIENKATCNKDKECPKCSKCNTKEKIFGPQCASKNKEHDKSYCEPKKCPKSQECNTCQKPVETQDSDGCCHRLKCVDLAAPKECVKPDAKGKCADDCHEPVDTKLDPSGACPKTVKCCLAKKCAAVEEIECEGCTVAKIVKDKCGCSKMTCLKDPEVAMCDSNVNYKVTLEIGGATEANAAALPKPGVNAAFINTVAPTAEQVIVKITGACTKEELTVPNAKKKECEVVFKKGSLSSTGGKTVSKACQNVGVIEKVEVVGELTDIVFVKEVKITTPNLEDPKKETTKKVPIEKIVGKINPGHVNWNKVGPWEPKEEVVVKEPFSCKKCEKIEVKTHINCTSKNEGFCEPKACPTVLPCGECDLTTPDSGDCGCAENFCTPLYKEEKECGPGFTKKVIAAAPCKSPNVHCVPNGPCEPVCKEEPKGDLKCSQCDQKVISQIIKIVNVNGEKDVCPCEKEICNPREKCLTKSEAEEVLECDPDCEEAEETDELLEECGCRKWQCVPKNQKTCDRECKGCEVCAEVMSETCGMKMFECVPHECQERKDCQVEKRLNGKPAVDDCNCPKYEDKPCIADHVHTCEEGKNRIVEGVDRCGCKQVTLEKCAQTEEPPCNGTCEHLVTKFDGCCYTWTCEKKPCPKLEKVECPVCHVVETKDDECHCCKQQCKRAPCAPMKACPTGTEPVTMVDNCKCQVLLECAPKRKIVEYCPKDKTCTEEEPTTVTVCKKGKCVED